MPNFNNYLGLFETGIEFEGLIRQERGYLKPKVTRCLASKAPKNWKIAKLTNFWRYMCQNMKIFSMNRSIFVNVAAFIESKCIVKHKMMEKSKKLLYLGYFSKFLK